MDVMERSQEFLELCKDELEEFLGDDHVETPREQEMLKALARWVLHRPALRARHGTSLLKKIRFGTMMNSISRRPMKSQLKATYPELGYWTAWEPRFDATTPPYPNHQIVTFEAGNEMNRPRVPR